MGGVRLGLTEMGVTSPPFSKAAFYLQSLGSVSANENAGGGALETRGPGRGLGVFSWVMVTWGRSFL